MNQITDTLRDSKRLRLIATALELMQYERTDSAVIPILGTEPQRYVVVGTAETVARLLEIAPAASTVSAPEEVRNQALEDAAKVAEDTDVATREWAMQRYDDGSQTRSDIVAAIRALRTTTDKGSAV